MEQKTTHNIVDTLNEIDDAVTQTNRQLWDLLGAVAILAFVVGLVVLSFFYNLKPFFSGLCTLLVILAGVGLIAFLIDCTTKYSKKIDETTKQYYIQYIQERHDFRHNTHAELVTFKQYLCKTLLMVIDISVMLGGFVMLLALGSYAASVHDDISACILSCATLVSGIGGFVVGIISFLWQFIAAFERDDDNRIVLGFNAKLYDYRKLGIKTPKSALLNRLVLFKLPPKEQ